MYLRQKDWLHIRGSLGGGMATLTKVKRRWYVHVHDFGKTIARFVVSSWTALNPFSPGLPHWQLPTGSHPSSWLLGTLAVFV